MVVGLANNLTFAAGQISPHLAGRYDFPIYKYGAEIIENMIVRPQGSVFRRPGTRVMRTTTPSARMIPFQATVSQGYLVVLYPNGNIEIIDGQNSQQVLVTPWALTGAAKMQEVDFVQVRSSLFLVHRDVPPLELKYAGAYSWSAAAMPLKDGPWESLNLDSQKKVRVIGGTPTTGFYTGGCTIGARKKDNAAGTWFDDTWVGRKMRLRQVDISVTPNQIFWANISIDSVATTHAILNATIDSNFPAIGNFASLTATGDSKNWRLSAWYSGNYPTRIGVFQNRLWFARDQWVWSTVIGDVHTFSPSIQPIDDTEWTVTDDAAIALQGIDPRVTQVQWFAGNKVLHFATDATHEVIQGGNSTGAITPGSVSKIVQSEVGAAYIKPVVNNYLYYVALSRQALYRADYQFQKNAYVPEKVNTYDDEILWSRITKMAIVTQPFTMLWCVMDTGRVVVYTMNEIDSIYAASTQIFYVAGVEANIQDVAVLRGSRGREYIYLLNEDGKVIQLGQMRTNNGEQSVTLTYGNSPVSGSTYHQYGAVFEDEYLTDDSTIFSPGGSVDLHSIASYAKVVDRYNYQQWKYNATSFSVTPTNTFEIGSPFFGKIRTNKIVNESSGQSDLNRRKSVKKVFFDVYRTLNFTVKEVESSFTETVSFGDLSSPFVSPPTPYTGIKELRTTGTRKETLQLEVTQESCTPLNINSINVEFDYDNLRPQ